MPSSSSPGGRSSRVTVPASGCGPGNGQFLELLDAAPFVVHVVGLDPVADAQPLGAAVVRLVDVLHLGVKLDPVLPAVGQHPVRLKGPLDDRLLDPLAGQRQPVAPVLQTKVDHACAVVDPRHHHRHHDLVGLDADVPAQPARVRRLRGARAQRQRPDLGHGAKRHRSDARGIGVVEHERVGRDLGDVAGHRGDHRRVTERAHDAARADRVGDVHDDAVLRWDLDVFSQASMPPAAIVVIT